jgi:ribosomal protein S21
VPAANPKYHNAKVDAGDEDVDGEELLRRFNWQVSRAGVMEEIRRRRRHEDARDKRKRKARSAARRFRRRCVLNRYALSIRSYSIVAWVVGMNDVVSLIQSFCVVP